MRRYIDTSALMPYYRPEPTSAQCEAVLLERPSDVWLSDLVEVEFASVLARLVRMGDAPDHDAVRIQRAFGDHILAGRYRRTHVDRAQMDRARDWLLSRTTALRTLDALHLACADALGAELVTADSTLAASARFLSVPALLIEPVP